MINYCYLNNYAFENQYQFIKVILEYFFETQEQL